MSSKQISWELKDEIEDMFFERFGFNPENPRIPTYLYHRIKDASVDIDIPIKYKNETDLEYRQIELLEDCETIKFMNVFGDEKDDVEFEYIKDKTLWFRYELLFLNRWL